MDIHQLGDFHDRIVEVIQPILVEFDVREADLHAAAALFNAVGEQGVFPSMLDTAFAMSLFDKRVPPGATPPNLEGPEYRAGAPIRPDGRMWDRPLGDDAVLLELTGMVREFQSGRPLVGAELDVWHVDENGDYDNGYHLRGRIITDEQGRYTLRSIIPVDYPEHEEDALGELLELMGKDKYRPAHIHVKVRVDNIECLTTQLYPPGSPHLHTDYIVGAVQQSLILDLKADEDRQSNRPIYRGEFDFSIDVNRVR